MAFCGLCEQLVCRLALFSLPILHSSCLFYLVFLEPLELSIRNLSLFQISVWLISTSFCLLDTPTHFTIAFHLCEIAEESRWQSHSRSFLWDAYRTHPVRCLLLRIVSEIFSICINLDFSSCAKKLFNGSRIFLKTFFFLL